MFKTLGSFYRDLRTLRQITRHPILGSVFFNIRDTLSDTSKALGKNASDEYKQSLFDKALTEVQRAIAQPNPVQGVRLRLLDLILQTAAYQVLVIPPRPELDETGLRAFEGITGELKRRIPDLACKDEHLKELFYAHDEPVSEFDEMFDVILFHYWSSHLFLSAFHVARCALKDYHNDPHKDWYRPCFISQCIWQESRYRDVLGLPSALTGSLSPFQ
jgi:hypothetical protein